MKKSENHDSEQPLKQAEVLTYLVENGRLKDGDLIGSTVNRERQLADVDWKTESVFGGKKYKPVDQKVKPILGATPEKFRIERNIIGDPLEGMPALNPNPPELILKGRYSEERKEKMDEMHGEPFLWPKERKLLHHVIAEQNEAFA